MFHRRAFATIAVPVLAVWLAGGGTAFAQVARVSGVVRDVNGAPLRGALVSVDVGHAIVTAATDDNGRFSVIGMRAGVWKFEVQAPGYLTETGELRVRAGGAQNPPVTIALRRSGLINTGPLAGLSARDIQEQLAAADAFYDQERWDEAITAYRAILARAPSLTAISLQIASAHRRRGDHAAAADTYRAILGSDPGNNLARVGLGMTSLEQGDPRAAEDVLREGAARPDAGREVLFSLAELLASQGREAEAGEWYERASTADPTWGRPRYRLGELALARGDESGAVRYLGEVIAIDPASPEAELAEATLGRLNKN